MLGDGHHPETVAQLADELAELRAAIGDEDDDGVIEALDRVGDKAGREATYLVLSELLRYARNLFADPGGAACVEVAAQRFRARFPPDGGHPGTTW